MTSAINAGAGCMSYEAQVYNVMLASPSDVNPERAVVRTCVNEWNNVNAMARGIVLQTIGWDTHSSPSMGGHPQKIINEKLLAKCDVLVGVFWTRVGTKTPDYESGSIEEVETHIATGKLAMLYFSNAPVRRDSVSDDQWQKLLEFKRSCKDRGIYHEYDTVEQFRDVFYRDLQIHINDGVFFSVPNARPESTELASPVAPVVILSSEATLLLQEATSDPSGTVLFLRHLGGTDLQTNGKNLISDPSRRVVAAWEAAVKELATRGLLVDPTGRGEFFQVTKSGYDVAENLAV